MSQDRKSLKTHHEDEYFFLLFIAGECSSNGPKWLFVALHSLCLYVFKGPPHTDAFFIRAGAFCHDASTYMHGRIVTDRNGTHEKRIRVGRG